MSHFSQYCRDISLFPAFIPLFSMFAQFQHFPLFPSPSPPSSPPAQNETFLERLVGQVVTAGSEARGKNPFRTFLSMSPFFSLLPQRHFPPLVDPEWNI